MGLIKGYTGFLHHQNLAANGNFRINQRGFGLGVETPAKVGDYVADCWRIEGSSVATLNAYLWPNVEGNLKLGGLRLFGYGSANQSVSILNIEKATNYVSMFSGEGSFPSGITVTANAICRAGSVPVAVGVTPPRGPDVIDYTYDLPVIRPGEPLRQVASRMTTALDRDASYIGSIGFTLQETGAFDVILSGYAVYPGWLKNPPRYSFVHYAEDFARCERYYQTVSMSYSGKFGQWNTDVGRIDTTIPFRTKMAGTPTVVVNPTTASQIYDGAGALSSTVATTVTAWGITDTGITASLIVPHANSYTLGHRVDVSFTATV